MKKQRKPLKRYIYVSTRKVDMFNQQRKQHPFLTWLVSWLSTTNRVKVGVGVVEIEKPAEVRAGDFSEFITLLATLERENTIGTVDAPAEYIKDTLPMFYHLIPSYPNYALNKDDPGLIYFGGHTKQTILALVGSPYHLIGRAKESTQTQSSDLPDILAYLNRRFRDIVNPQLQEEIDRYEEVHDHGIATIQHADMMNRDPRIRMEFVAYRILDSADIEGYEPVQRLLLYSPIYVAYASDIAAS